MLVPQQGAVDKMIKYFETPEHRMGNCRGLQETQCPSCYQVETCHRIRPQSLCCDG